MKTGSAAVAAQVVLLALLFGVKVSAEPLTTVPATGPAVDIDHLRDALIAAYNRGDVEGLLHFVHPDAVIIFPDGQILKGREGLRDYYNRMLKAPDHHVASFTAEPVVQSRTLHNDVGLSYGMMNDRYVLTDGKSFALNSRFTVTLMKSSDGPSEAGGWMIRSFHASTDAFDNPILGVAARRGGEIGGAVGAVVGIVLGFAVAWWLFSRRRRSGG